VTSGILRTIADGVKLTEYSKTELTLFLRSQFWQMDSVVSFSTWFPIKHVVWNFVMYVATPSAWKANVNKGLVWILCITHKCIFIAFWVTVSNLEGRIRGPVRRSCCYYSTAWMLANARVVGEMIWPSDAAFETLVPLGYHRSNSKPDWLALRWCCSDRFLGQASTVWVNSVIAMSGVGS